MSDDAKFTRDFDLLDDQHPLKVIDEIIRQAKKDGENLLFTFGAFSFNPGEYSDEDKYEWQTDAGFTGDEVAERCNDLADFFKNAKDKDWDVVIQSDVEVQFGPERVGLDGALVRSKTTKHIPQIDFVCHPRYNELGRRDDLKCPFEGLIYFESGRSMHAYATRLLKKDEWNQYLGKLLLMNPPGIEVTDSRWVGHGLSRDYTALRLTANNEKYLTVPRLMKRDPWDPVTVEVSHTLPAEQTVY